MLWIHCVQLTDMVFHQYGTLYGYLSVPFLQNFYRRQCSCMAYQLHDVSCDVPRKVRWQTHESTQRT